MRAGTWARCARSSGRWRREAIADFNFASVPGALAPAPDAEKGAAAGRSRAENGAA